MPSTTINVPATQLITNSPITLRTGQPVELNASGQWNIYNDPKRWCGPTGSDATAHFDPENGHGHWPQEGIQEGCLLVYLNNVIRAHFINNGPLLITGPGILGFGPNDNYLSDNQGSIQVRIDIDDDEDTLSQNP